MRVRAFAIALCLAFTAAVPAAMAAYPEKPIRLIIPYPAGGTQDAMIRSVQEHLQKLLGQAVIIDNKAGAAGVLGMQEVGRASPDGYTIGLANNGMVITPLVQSSLAKFDLAGDLAPVTMVASGPLVIFANPSIQGDDLRGLVASAQARPEGVTFASTGIGGLGHLTAELIAKEAGIKAVHVPYRGNAPAMLAVMSGEVQFLVSTVSDTALQSVQAKKLKILGVSTLKSSPALPGVPPISNVLPNFDHSVWFGIVAPKGTPAPIVETLGKAFAQVLSTAEVRKLYTSYGLIPETSTPQQMSQAILRERATWTPIVRELNVKVD